MTTWPLLLDDDRLTSLTGARTASTALPNPAPAGSIRAQRRVPADGVVMVASQRLRIGRQHKGKLITIVAEDKHFRVIDGDQELSTHVRTVPKMSQDVLRRPGTA
ncbi:hypothetical protein [Jatrophihabitans sp. GAS493]|uniref:hypothetical protein n=1 Tax=Jatrophihabitans sp. GAS493 TaxID=1907575 RepID=UPI000BB7CD7A|nr:hypothetical protein [Jatrophihabitans sp. GAS493]